MAFLIPAAAALFAKVTVAAVVKFVVTTALSIGVSRLLAKRAMKKAQAGGDGGGRVQLPPATDNKVPVVYGVAYIGGPIVDAYLTPDQKTMYYVVALSEKTDNGTISYGDVYYDGKLVTFGSDGSGGTTKVTQLINNSTSPSQTDTRVNGFLNIFLYRNGSTGATSGTNTTQNAYDVFPGWSGNPTYAMTDCAFAIVKVKYSTDASTTGLGALNVQVVNTESGQTFGRYRPGTALRDYMTNTRYGCAIPLSQVDTDSLDDVNTYSDQFINYKPVGWVSGDPYQQTRRYSISGPLDTANNCLDNLQFLVDTCDSWLQYSELQGKWKVVLNKGYDQSPDAQTLNDLFLVDSSNLVGGIEISPIDLNETYNQVEVAYPNRNIKDQTDYQILDLYDLLPSLLSQNEAVNRLNITLPLVSNAIRAKYLGARRLLQSREDLVVSFRTDYSGIQVEAGDVIRIDHEVYGWTDKLFRVSEVIEEKDTNGNLFASFRAFEYNGTVYTDDPIQDFIPAFNTGLKDPNIISPPCDPVVTSFTDTDGLITGFNVESCVPEEGLVLYMDFNYGNNSNVLTHLLYRTLQQSDGEPFTPSPDIANGNVTSVAIDVNDLPAGNLYWSVTARNNTAGRRSGAGNVFPWGGANIQPYDPNTGNGGVNGNQVQANTITFNNLSNNFITTQSLGAYNWTIGNNAANTINMPANIATLGNISTGNFQQPLYITSVYSGGGGLYPFYDGTSNIADYYQANSTSSFNPIGADQLALVNGDLNWWVAAYRVATSNVTPGFYMRVEYNSQIVSDTDTVIQMIPFVRTGSNPANTFLADTETMYTTDLYAGLPYRVNFAASYTSTGNITSGGVVMRLLSTANVVMVNGSFGISRGKT